MTRSPKPLVRLAQLPVPPPAAFAATGNAPLAAGMLAVAAQVGGLDRRARVEIAPRDWTDLLGDALLADALAADEPAIVCLSLYLWNAERSLRLARAVKERSPRTRVLIGGPEVSPDNQWLLEAPGWDLAIAGEAEETFCAAVDALLAPGAGLPPRTLPEPAAAAFPLQRFPSPYLLGLLPVEAAHPLSVETARGCASRCTYCFYPRSSAAVRRLSPLEVGALVAGLRERGARDVSFLDPTFNHRPDFDELLAELRRANGDGALTFFAEVRPEGLTAARAKAMRACGFQRVEIGLQSVNPETLRRAHRGGSAELVAEAAHLLAGEGIELLVDLLVGLPGDGPDDVARGLDFLAEQGLAEAAQLFPLSVLPGTPLRRDAAREGVEHDPLPPYRVRRTAELGEEELLETLRLAEERLGRRLDEVPRPHLCREEVGGDPGGPPDRFALDLDRADASSRDLARAPGGRHAALWLSAADLWSRRGALLAAVDARLSVDPDCTLDVVLRAEAPFPIDLVEAVRARFARAPAGWGTRALAHRGEDGQRRVVVSLPGGARPDPGWLEAISSVAPVYQDRTLAEAAREAAALGDGLPCALVVGPVEDPSALRSLADSADPTCVGFVDRTHEASWTARVLGSEGSAP